MRSKSRPRELVDDAGTRHRPSGPVDTEIDREMGRAMKRLMRPRSILRHEIPKSEVYGWCIAGVLTTLVAAWVVDMLFGHGAGVATYIVGLAAWGFAWDRSSNRRLLTWYTREYIDEALDRDLCPACLGGLGEALVDEEADLLACPGCAARWRIPEERDADA